MAQTTLQNYAMTKNNDRDLERKLNWLRAAVLGANDGIVSVAGIVVGVAAAGASYQVILLAGVAAIVAGAISMGGGEFISVSAQRDTEIAHGRKKGQHKCKALVRGVVITSGVHLRRGAAASRYYGSLAGN